MNTNEHLLCVIDNVLDAEKKQRMTQRSVPSESAHYSCGDKQQNK